MDFPPTEFTYLFCLFILSQIHSFSFIYFPTDCFDFIKCVIYSFTGQELSMQLSFNLDKEVSKTSLMHAAVHTILFVLNPPPTPLSILLSSGFYHSQQYLEDGLLHSQRKTDDVG